VHDLHLLNGEIGDENGDGFIFKASEPLTYFRVKPIQILSQFYLSPELWFIGEATKLVPKVENY
jgi:hypothetical protein